MLVRLKVELLKRGISQKALADALDVHPSHVSRVIRGHARPRARDRRRIAEFLGVSQRKLFPRVRPKRTESAEGRK